MTKIVYLDTGVLGYLTHPKGSDEATACTEWLLSLLEEGVKVCIPEICDYELRREYVRNESKNALLRLDKLKKTIEFVIIESQMMLKAADFWAYARNSGKETADRHALDGDVILAAQAIISAGAETPHIATTNVGHLSIFVKANKWSEITSSN